jgi:hypothetical protein
MKMVSSQKLGEFLQPPQHHVRDKDKVDMSSDMADVMTDMMVGADRSARLGAAGRRQVLPPLFRAHRTATSITATTTAPATAGLFGGGWQKRSGDDLSSVLTGFAAMQATLQYLMRSDPLSSSSSSSSSSSAAVLSSSASVSSGETKQWRSSSCSNFYDQLNDHSFRIFSSSTLKHNKLSNSSTRRSDGSGGDGNSGFVKSEAAADFADCRKQVLALQ